MTDETSARRRPVTRGEFEALKAAHDALSSRLDLISAQLTTSAADQKKAATLIEDMHRAFMEPSPGQPISLLEWVAKLRIASEGGDRVIAIVLTTAKVLAALGVIGGAIAVALRLNGVR